MLEWLKTILGEAYTDEIDRAVSAELDKNYAPASEVTRLNGEIRRLGGVACDWAHALRKICWSHRRFLITSNC